MWAASSAQHCGNSLQLSLVGRRRPSSCVDPEVTDDVSHGAAKKPDVSQAVELVRLLHETCSEEPPAEEIGHGKTWVEILPDPRRTILVAEEDGRIIATLDALMVPNLTSRAPWAIVESMVIARAHRRPAIGRALMREVLARAEAAVRTRFSCCRTSRPPSRTRLLYKPRLRRQC
jgi:hypothetical protein